MKTFTRREFLHYSGIGGAAIFSGAWPLSMPVNAENRKVIEIGLTAAVTSVNLGTGSPFQAWTYNGRTPGPEIRVTEGDLLRVTLRNDLAEETTIHWHGLPVPNRMDGVPDVTQKPARPGETFVYEFIARPAGSYLYHSHVGYQLDRGLYGVLIVDPRREELSYDREYTVTLEDWARVDGGGPEASRQGRTDSGGMMGMMDMMRGRRGENDPLLEPRYDAFAINGRVFEAAIPFLVRKGDKVRFRFVNPSSSTIYTIRIAGHSFTVTHADGRPLVPFEADALRIGMGERYDVMLHADNPGRWRIYNLRDDSAASGRPLGVLLYDGVIAGDFNSDSEKRLRLNEYGRMAGIEEDAVPPVGGTIDRVFRMTLSGGMMGSPYWTINDQVYPNTEDLNIRPGEQVRFEYFNHSMMPHPMHLHGHFFEIAGTGRDTGVRVKKDTVIIPGHMGRGAIEFLADNPGAWLHHCHNLYHMEGGMANVVKNFAKS